MPSKESYVISFVDFFWLVIGFTLLQFTMLENASDYSATVM